MLNRHSSAGNPIRKNVKSGTDLSAMAKLSSTMRQASISCNFRYIGTYILIIISDGCDQLRQQQWLQQWINSNKEQQPGNQLLVSLAELNEFNQNWSNKFIANVVQQIDQGKLNKVF